MSAVEEHKPVEKRRALGRGLDSLLPAGPRIVTASSSPSVAPAVPPPVVIPPAAPFVAPASTTPELQTTTEPAKIAEIHAVREETSLPTPAASAAGASSVAPTSPIAISGEIAEIHAVRDKSDSRLSQNRGEVGHPINGDQS